MRGTVVCMRACAYRWSKSWVTSILALKDLPLHTIVDRGNHPADHKQCGGSGKPCCIDKGCRAELSEAINSMYQWYRHSQKCYVYLNDVDEPALPTKQDFSRFGECNGWPEWFPRGWTLQEFSYRGGFPQKIFII
ncbi:hypothetical protein BKA82DRAFT_722338 [Pisolithus tinctorius]|uniref:Uncharacterized protein n=1 Tax=Pisolithus tinctorius Marx 270 TaxID=870435 RepID=A0A0C3P2Y3_PISTI|nr:hypothetical protein BKA82DRAFT_722338 [Pisolithus tinctorius]KIO01664.1 hypothetical protein M404DRAFT_722338 [Pisolithus tinctorius Marx 270]